MRPGHIVPFEGRMSYCLTKCLKMILAYYGDDYALPFLECVSTEPFGFVYVREANGGLAVNGYEYDHAGERMLQLLGYDYELLWFDDQEQALLQMDSLVKRDPVVVGMLNMGSLEYRPDYHEMAGADHALVVLERRNGIVIVHDPDGYVCVSLPLNSFLEAWRADHIYTGKSYMLWVVGKRARQPTNDELYSRALELGLENLHRTSTIAGNGTRVLFGPEALQTLAQDLRDCRAEDRWLRVYKSFTFRVSGQRCFDSSFFIKQAPFQNSHLVRCAEIRFEQAVEYGQAQLAAVTEETPLLAYTLERIAVLEKKFIDALENGLRTVDRTHWN